MEELLTSLLSNTQGVIAYAAVFLILLACGLGVPLPEDISPSSAASWRTRARRACR